MDFLTLAVQLEDANVNVIKGIGFLISILLAVIAVLNYKKNFGSAVKSEGSESGQLVSDVGYLKSGIDDIKRVQEKQADNYVTLICEVGKQGESIKSAHHRIDTIEENIRTRGQFDGTGLQ